MDKNLETYNSGKVVDWYNHLHELVPVEKFVFEKYEDVLLNANLLDIGIGAGRTTDSLLSRTSSYTGIDYSENFIASSKKKFPGASILKMDARDLSAFKNESFDFVNFSFNGVDYVDLNGREKIFSEVSRVLKKKGIFFFSTHNKTHSSFNKDPWLNKNNSLFTNIKTFIKLLPFQYRKLKNKKSKNLTTDYAIINDSAHSYGLMTFYTSPEFLRKQLSDKQFADITFYTISGKSSADEELEDWIFVTAVKI